VVGNGATGAARTEAITMMHGYGYGWSGGWIFMGLFWFLLLALIVFLVLRLLPGGGGRIRWQQGESPLDVLDHRFARGELDLETYRSQRAALQEALAHDRRK
jgi:putative membrane protein